MRSVVAAALRSHRISVSGSISYNRRNFTTQSKDRIIRLDQAFLGGVLVAATTIIFFENDNAPQSNTLVQQNIPSEHNDAAASLHHHQSASSRVRRTLTSGLVHRQLTVPKYTIPMATAIRNDTPSKTTAECSASATDDKIQFATPIKDINKIYDIGRILGEGGYGQVVFATRRADSKTVALKCIPKEWTDSDGFKCEIEVLQKLNTHAGGHPHVCCMYDFLEDEDNFYTALELIEGGELFEHLIEEGAYSEARAAVFMRQFAEALAFMHQAGGELKVCVP